MPRDSTARLLLSAASPEQWIDTHLADHYRQHSAEPLDGVDQQWVSIADVLAGDGALLRSTHAGLRAGDGATSNAAAKWVTSWFPGMLADAVGFTLATASAALVLDESRVRWRLHSGGWPEQVDATGSTVAVSPEHPWAGLPGVEIVADDGAVARRAILALTVTIEPLVEACHRLARVGRTTLWAEVADGFGLPLTMQPALPVDPAAVTRLQDGLRVTGARWRKHPDLRVAETGDRTEYLGRKGGCCLAYQCPAVPEHDPQTLDDRERAYQQRFPTQPGQPQYCSTCSLRDLADCEDRQSFWLRAEREADCAAARS